MLYELFLDLSEHVSVFNVFRYITFRIILAALTSMSLWLILGSWYIKTIKSFRVNQIVREDGPRGHSSKSGTPTMGGVLLLFTSFTACLLWINWSSGYVRITWLVILLFGLVGFGDDYLKVTKKRNLGLTGKQKLMAQCVIGLLAGLLLNLIPSHTPVLTVPGLKFLSLDLGPLYALFATLILVGSSNAVNLTDGLDGLAIGPIILAAATYMVFAYCSGNSVISNHLQILGVPGASEVAVLLAALIGGGLGFLWFNSYPAQIFLGDVGSLSLGAALGMAAIVVKQELLLILVGGLFVIEALSVILQVTFFKATRGRRILQMAPLHHHFELLGWPESKITIRFWIIAIILSLAGLSTLKLR
ncbi:MAG: phospho-N-acetylmuramoyl-pentapeptide-transferase [Deltaproteobacteria bacterium]|jgi:phospho-N-acetylmuramoyl-pentapeptide-transferase|nr:phospho-N-acetylmuramoyl-pentapeptide-transferase [Deltaproteobacteria bacterium]